MSTPLLTVADVADRLHKSTRFVLDELRRKNLRGARFGGQWHITEDDLAAYVEAHMNVAKVRRSA